MPQQRLLLVASLSALIVSIVAMTPRGGAAAENASCSVATYNAVGDFSTMSNPNGSWSYGWEATLGGPFTLNAVEDSETYQGIDLWEGPDNCGAEPNGHPALRPFVGVNHTGATLDYASGVSQPASMLVLHPSCTGKLSALRWTAPATGWFDVVGLFQGIDIRNTTTDVHVLQNSTTSLLSGNINGFGNQAPFNFTRYLAAGETLDFVVGWGFNGNYGADSTGLAVTITNGEPTSTVFNIPDGDVAGLIAAIQTANANCDASATTINLAPGGTYTLTTVAENPPEFNGPQAVGLPVIRASVTINGNGATIQRSPAPGTPDFLLLAVSGRTAAGPPACYPEPVLTLNQTILTGGSQGGIHINSAAALVNNSTVTQNTGGGGINNACGSLTLLNSTVSYNSSDSGYGGGGVFFWGFSCAPGKPVADISFSTIYENANPGWGRGNAIGTAFAPPGGVRLKNSILASPSHPSEAVCNSGNNILVSLGHNILGDATDVFGSRCYEALTAPGDMINTNPRLGPLANNGGLTPTHLPNCDSPAVDAVPLASSSDVAGIPVTTDQRGISRPQGAASDIGAVEVGTTMTVTIPSTTGPWLQSLNPTFDYGAHDNTPPVVIDAASGLVFTPGSTLTVTYLSGTVQAGAGYPPNDANGLPGYVRNYCENFGCFPAFFMNPRPDLLAMALVGAFTNNGVIVGYPFPIGNGPKTLTIPTGANQLSLGINDTRVSDNSGFFTIAVSGGGSGLAPTITSQPVSLTKCESQAATFSVAATGTGLTYQWYKNGTPIAGATGGTFSIAAVNSGDAGSYYVVITGTCGSTTSDAAMLTVNAATGIATQPLSQTRCLGAAASFSVTASGAGPFTYQWRKNGSLIPYATNNSFSIASVVAGDAGSYDVVVTGVCGSVSSNAATLSVNLPPTANAGGPYTVNEGGSITVTASGSDLEGGPLAFAWDLDNNGSFETSGQSVPFSAAALDGPSSRTIRVQVTDNCNLPTTASAIVTVLNVAPAVGAITASVAPIPVNTTINTSASFTDPGRPDTHTAIWNWDDLGNPTSAGAVTETNGSGSVSGSHTFTAAGVYEVKLAVTDDDGGAGQSIFQYVVVYDPDGGFVTGGGWINSPTGAYGPDPTLSGRANFGFVSKYKKGANVPTGNTEFQFEAGNFNFHSTVYEWMVVAGAKAQYKGSGTVNGAGDYRFMLTATDGQINGGGGVDKFRIKIWDNASGGVIYDNKRGTSDDIDSADPQAIGGGSIVIHKD
jgi:hypothetical protein